MKHVEPTGLTIFLPYGSSYERRTSSRYYWDNARRGEDSFVIIQKTLRGSGAFTWEGKSWESPSEHAFIAIVPEASTYGYPSGAKTPWEFSWLNLGGALSAQLCREIRRQYGPVLPLPGKSAAGKAFDSLIRQSRGRQISNLFDVSIRAYAFLIEWTRQLSEPELAQKEPVEAATHLCHTRFRERIGVKELAWETGVSREHLTRIFTERHSVSPAQYLRQLRTDEARRMLSTLGLPLKEAAQRCGFPSPRALSRALAGS